MNKLEKTRQTCVEMLKELNVLQKNIEKSLKKAPEGTLNLSSSNGTSQYYHKTQKNEKKGKYIEKGNVKLIKALAQKDYDLRMLKEIEIRKKHLQGIKKKLPEKGLEEIYASLPLARKQFVMPHVTPDEEYIKEWMEVEYEGKSYPLKFGGQFTERGEQVRSKSEKIIADKLYAMGIPYRYEYPLYISGFGTIYPDFTILKVSTREEFYFEHFGLMDDPDYCRKAILKLQTYAKNQLFPGKGLLISFETLNHPLDITYVEKLLNAFILDQ